MKEIYLDNSATTRLSTPAREAMISAMDCYGNPSSTHSCGMSARKIVEGARGAIGKTLGLSNMREGELVFTASGSEADNLAILGCARAKARRSTRKIISTDSEHPAVENQLALLQNEGFEIVRVPTQGGVLDMELLEKELDSNTFMVSMMLVNNETGAVYDLKKVFALAKKRNPDVICHCDAIQGYLKVRFTPQSLGADLVALSAHKIHGPKGVGALYICPEIIKAKKISPVVFGGGQEHGYRSGTENVIGIAGFGAAAENGYKNFICNVTYVGSLRAYAIEKLRTLDIEFNIPKGSVAPHILNITLPSIKSETMLNFLSERGIFVSAGSACSSNSRQKHISRSLIAFGLDEFAADCSLRLSFSEENSTADIDALADALADGISSIVKIRK